MLPIITTFPFQISSKDRYSKPARRKPRPPRLQLELSVLRLFLLYISDSDSHEVGLGGNMALQSLIRNIGSRLRFVYSSCKSSQLDSTYLRVAISGLTRPLLCKAPFYLLSMVTLNCYRQPTNHCGGAMRRNSDSRR